MSAPALVRDSAWVALGLGGAQLLLWAATPLLTRFYGPAAFAALGLWLAVAAVVSVLVLLRYDTHVVIAADEAEAQALVRLCLLLAAALGALLLLAAWAVPAPIALVLGLAPLGPWLPSAVMGGVLAAALAAGLAWANRQGQVQRMTGARLMAAALTVALGVGLGAAGWGDGLLIAQLSGTAVALLALRWPRGPWTAGALRAAANTHRAAPQFLWPSALLDTFTQQLPMALAVLWFSTEVAGQFSLAWRVVAAPALMLAAAVGTVLYPRLARLVDQPMAARALLLKVWRTALLVGAVPALLLLLAGGPLFAWLFGPTWREAGLLAGAMAPMLLAMAASAPTSGALIVLGLQRWSPVFGMAMLMYRPAALALGAWKGSLVLGLFAWAVCEIVAIVLYNRLILRRLRP